MGLVQALKRQAGIKSAVVDFKKGMANATFKEGAKLDLGTLKNAINKSSEMTFKSLTLAADGEVTEHAGKPALKVTGTNQLFLLAGERAPAKGKRVTVTGKVQEPKKGQAAGEPLTLAVERIENKL